MKKITLFTILCATLGMVFCFSLNSQAATFPDASNDLFDNGLANLDITGVEVTNNGVNLVIAVTTRGFATWTKYLIWIDTPAKANAASASNGWGRPASMASGEGADFFAGSWVDATPNNVQLWDYSGTSWVGPSSFTTVNSGSTVTFTLPLSALGLSAGDVIRFDVATSGGGGGDPGVDHASRSSTATTGWGVSSTGGSMFSYTIASLADSDSDGLTDSWENTYFGNLDQTGSGDSDSDGLANSGELTAGTSPTIADTDSDGLNDGAEVSTHTTNPLVADTDGDGVNDGAEITAGTNPKKTNHSLITIAGGFQGWSPAPTNSPSNIMTKVAGDEFGWELNFRMTTATIYFGKFTAGSWDVNWGTSGTPGKLQLGGFGNDVPFNVAATGVYRFYFNTDTLDYSFARASAPANYADWAAQYGLTADSGSDDPDADTLLNSQEFSANTDPTNGDTDGDGLFDEEEVSGVYANLRLGSPVVTSPLTRDTDGDGLPDRWEVDNFLDPTDSGLSSTYANYISPAFGLTITGNPNGAGSNPDGDALTNLQEYSGSKNPIVAEGETVSSYPKVVVAGSFVQTKPDGSWDELGNPNNTMQLVSNFTWKLMVYLPSVPSFAQFKFTTGAWSTNFGDDIPQGGAADGVGDPNGANINALPVFTAPGYFMITFNDFSKEYTMSPLAAVDADSDSLPDAWEAYYGGLLEPKRSDLVPTEAYIAGSSTTAAQAYAAGVNPVADVIAPTIGLAAGVDKLIWVAKDTAVTLANSDVTASDDISSSPVVTFDPATVDTAVDGLTTVTYTATDAAGNASTATRVIAVGNVEPGWRKLHYPRSTTISTAGSTSVYGRIYLAGATPGAGQAPNISVELGIHAADTDPSGWASSAWQPAVHNAGFTDGDDEYSSTINGGNLAAGTYYYAFRFKIGSGPWVYGGINAAGTDGGPWDGVANGNGVLTVNAALLRDVTFAVDMGVQIFKGAFDPATNGVEVRATFNNFAGGASALSRVGTSTIYSGTFQAEGAEGATNNYKFFATGTNTVGYEAGSDRQAVLTASGTPLNTGTNFFSNLTESRKITFRVDMSVQAAKGNFNTNTGTVSVAGSFNGWSGPVSLAAQGANIYAAEVLVDGALSALEYKFVNGTAYEDGMNNRTITALLPNLQASTLDPVFFLNDDGLAPTDIGLSASTIAENNAVNSVVGTLSSMDATAGDIHSYSLVLGAGDVDNASFNISGTDLRASVAFNFEVKASYSIRVRSTDAKGNLFEKQFTVTVTDVAESGGATFADWSNGGTLDDANLAQYAIGGASSLAATDGVKPTSTVSGGNLVLTAIVRVNDPKLAVVGEAVRGLDDFATPGAITEINGDPAGVDQTGVPVGHEKQAFTVPQGADSRKFLRLKATLTP